MNTQQPESLSEAATIIPMAPTTPPHRANNTLPPHTHNLDGVEPVDILRLFITTPLLQEMAVNTNAYAQQKMTDTTEDVGRKWKEVTPEELGVWLGITIYMGVHCTPAGRDYWKHDGLNPTHPITNYMSQTQFEQIKRYFHVNHPEDPLHSSTGRRLWHSKVDRILEQLRKSSKAYQMPSTHIALDEAMIQATGHSPDTYKMPRKPIEQGFKFHVVAEHGYVWDFHSTSNQVGPDPVPSIEGLTATGQVVNHLVSQLPRSKYWMVYLDNFYTTLPLLGRLLNNFQIGGCGTERPSLAGFPPELKGSKQDITKHEYHTMQTMSLSDSAVHEGVGALLWFDNAPVTFMSTVHELASTVERIRK